MLSKREFKRNLQSELGEILYVYNVNRFENLVLRNHKSLRNFIAEMKRYRRDYINDMTSTELRGLNRSIAAAEDREKAGIRLSNISNRLKRMFKRK